MEVMSKSKMSVLASLQITVPFGYGVKGFRNSGAQHGARTLSSRISYSTDWKSACSILIQFPPGIVKMDSITGGIRESGHQHIPNTTLTGRKSTPFWRLAAHGIRRCMRPIAALLSVAAIWQSSSVWSDVRPSPHLWWVCYGTLALCVPEATLYCPSIHVPVRCFLNSFTGCLPYFRVQVFRVLALQAHVHHHPKYLPTYRASKESRLCFCAIEHWSMFAAMDTLLCNFATFSLLALFAPAMCRCTLLQYIGDVLSWDTQTVFIRFGYSGECCRESTEAAAVDVAGQGYLSPLLAWDYL